MEHLRWLALEMGLTAQILNEHLRAVITQCYGRSLNLACSDTVKQCKLIRNDC